MQDKSPKKMVNYYLLFKATKRTVAFVAVWDAAVFVFFLAAQFRRFLDANMIFLTRILAAASIALLVLLCFYLVQIIVCLCWYKNIKYLAAFGIFFPAAIIAVVVLAVTLSIRYVSGGI
jgi:hypothetical protein